MLRSQGGPCGVSLAWLCPLLPCHGSTPSCPAFSSFAPSSLLVLSLLPTRRPLDCLGHHRASCSRVEVLGRPWLRAGICSCASVPRTKRMSLNNRLRAKFGRDCCSGAGSMTNSGDQGRAKLVVLAGETGGLFSEETQTFILLLARAKTWSRTAGHTGGVLSWFAPLIGHTRCLCSSVVANRGGWRRSLRS